MSEPLVSIIMGSQSDWSTMQAATTVLSELDIPFESSVVSAHRTPARLVEFAESACGTGIQGDHCWRRRCSPPCRYGCRYDPPSRHCRTGFK